MGLKPRSAPSSNITRLESNIAAANRIDGAAVREHFADQKTLFEKNEARTGAFVDIEVLSFGGAVLLGETRTSNLTVPTLAETIIIEGDLVVDGVFEQPFRSAVIVVEGSLTAKHLVTCGYLVVLGDLKVSGTFYGNCTNYYTVVFGNFESSNAILEKNHLLGVHGNRKVDMSLEDEVDGYEATEAWMATQGVGTHDEPALAAVLRRGYG